ncbi:hypothetical protein F7230_06695 [Corynebacterium sp. 320]|uniref:galactan 5-O-arabinofuranosyltransferase n=1 Tax=Corynebacterium TaxID=1716 RepID=UPI00125CBA6D|nr:MULTISPECIES: galactan 5-O-arabinofuranosyltransferase [Corynebacterium]KAB1502705.1 hypothetical protein F7230_06695 [Corynebacterium sp. 320]KAB1550557.1 hypothetical protein F7232_09815 [Corynebacterium sp. 319]KAB1554716.1 hypothetical protein F7233_00010 [Corynebacterium sp. 321]KAB3526368.1 hypothetical protein F8354_06695 [Corynebacterium sp. 250]KAB3537787.1 hypothetical protein F8390_09785 [Corynebacterium sp. 366]
MTDVDVRDRTASCDVPEETHAHADYAVDPLSLKQTFLRLIAVGITAAVVTLMAWAVLRSISWPAYNSSWVLRALATAGSMIVTVATAWICYRWIQTGARRRSGDAQAEATDGQGTAKAQRSRALAFILQYLGYLAPAGLVITSTAIPLAATHLYLDGISVDNEFRTQYLTRMADSLSHADMAYVDIPSFYPGLWFFGGGALAHLVGMSGWAVFQPWALATIAMAGSMVAVVWHRILGSFVVAVATALASTAVVLVVAPEEPYAAVVALGMAPGLILARRAVTGGNAALIATIAYLGLSANLYTLFTAISALAVVIIALGAAWSRKAFAPIVRLVIIGVSSLAIAAVGWGPYILRLLSDPHDPAGTAQHYLPEAGTELPTPFFDDPTIAIASLIGLFWLVWRYRDEDTRAITIGLATCFLWVVMSMLMPLAGSTLLGFRVGGPIAVLLTVAGVLGVAQFRLNGLKKFYPELGNLRESTLATRLMVIVLALACVSYTSLIPEKNEEKIDLAYTDSDGNGNRGDKFPADATTYYQYIDRVLHDALGQRAGSVVLTDESNFLAYYPYNSFQAFTAHYANPLGQYSKRAQDIEEWTTISDPQELQDAMATAEREHGFKQPDALVLRGQLELKESAKQLAELKPEEGQFPTTTGVGKDGFSYKIADDIYPNNPNVRFRTVTFKPQAFTEGWDLTQVGPFVLAVRQAAKT